MAALAKVFTNSEVVDQRIFEQPLGVIGAVSHCPESGAESEHLATIAGLMG